MNDRWIFAITLTIVLGILTLATLIALYADSTHSMDTQRAEARIAACKTLPMEQVIICLKDNG